MFPISLEGSIDIPEISLRQTNDVMARLVSALERERASEVVCDGNTVRFCGGIRPGAIFSSWNVLNTVSRGTISVSSGSNALVKYRLSFLGMFMFSTLILIAGWLVIPADKPALFRFGAPLLLWFWVFGMNYVVASLRLPAFIRKAVAA
jgi:hypothetical protein